MYFQDQFFVSQSLNNNVEVLTLRISIHIENVFNFKLSALTEYTKKYTMYHQPY